MAGTVFFHPAVALKIFSDVPQPNVQENYTCHINMRIHIFFIFITYLR